MKNIPIKKCYSSPWCEPDQVCRCEAYEEQEGKRKPLTKTEKKVWEFILKYDVDNGYSPTLFEIGQELGYTRHAEQTVKALISRMIGKSYLRIDRKKTIRKIVIITQ